jgi:hypothetical protein
MSFNKRYFCKDSILSRYKWGGAEAVVSSFTKVDGAIFDDSFSSQIGDAVYKRDVELIDKLIQKEINMTKDQVKDELIKILEDQVMDLSMMTKIELGDDVITEVRRLKATIVILEENEKTLEAKRLVDDYRLILGQFNTDAGEEFLCTIISKQLAEKTVDEIISALDVSLLSADIQWWKEVKQAIKKI